MTILNHIFEYSVPATETVTGCTVERVNPMSLDPNHVATFKFESGAELTIVYDTLSSTCCEQNSILVSYDDDIILFAGEVPSHRAEPTCVDHVYNHKIHSIIGVGCEPVRDLKIPYRCCEESYYVLAVGSYKVILYTSNGYYSHSGSITFTDKDGLEHHLTDICI